MLTELQEADLRAEWAEAHARIMEIDATLLENKHGEDMPLAKIVRTKGAAMARKASRARELANRLRAEDERFSRPVVDFATEPLHNLR